MKKQILKMAVAMAMIGSIAAGCSSDKAATSGSDSTKMDSTSKMKPDSTSKPDSTKKDSTKTPPM